MLLSHLIPNNDSSHMLKVVDVVDDAGCWKWSILSGMFDTEILERIEACHPPKEELGDDLCRWRWSTTGMFSVKSAYKNITAKGVLNSESGSEWKDVWRSMIPPRIKTFLWLVKHGRLLTNC